MELRSGFIGNFTQVQELINEKKNTNLKPITIYLIFDFESNFQPWKSQYES